MKLKPWIVRWYWMMLLIIPTLSQAGASSYKATNPDEKVNALSYNDLIADIESYTSFNPAQKNKVVQAFYLHTKGNDYQQFLSLSGIQLKGAGVVNGAGNDLLNYINSQINKNIRNSILELPESRVVAQKYFNRINENPANYLSDYTVHLNDFDTWYANVFKSELFEAHHIIPKNVLRDNANLQNILDWARNNGKTWDFGKIHNGIMLQKRRKNNLGEVVGDHANHPHYDEQIYQKIDDIIENNNGNMSDAYDDFVEFVNDLKQQINTEVVEGNHIINTITIP